MGQEWADYEKCDEKNKNQKKNISMTKHDNFCGLKSYNKKKHIENWNIRERKEIYTKKIMKILI